MTGVDHTAGGSEDDSEIGSGVGGEVLLTLELVGLCAFAFSRPILDSFGRSPETFVARDADGATVVWFALIVVFVPVAIVALLGGAARLLGTRVRWWVHLALLALLGGAAVWRLGMAVTGYSGSAVALLVAGVVAVPLVVVLRTRVSASRTFLRFAGAASVVFLVQFLFMSPTASLIDGDPPGVDPAVQRAVAESLGDDAPPVVVIVADMLPTQALLDGAGHIDADLYPNIAGLASTATWYRNSTTVSAYTTEAVPALLTGTYPEDSASAEMLVQDPHNLFTLLGGAYDMHVHESATRLCPEEICPRESGGVGPLVGDAVDLWRGSVEETTEQDLDVPGLLTDDRVDEMAAWIEAQDLSPGGRPDLFFYHVLLPHDPWMFLPDGETYQSSEPPSGIFPFGFTDSGAGVGRQRLVLQTQALDALLGRLFERMREAGIYDDALIALASDHGVSFTAWEPWRAVSEGNYAEIMWAPLIIKAPGQVDGAVVDDNVETVDLMPTLADRLGVEVPWPVDGLVAGAERRDPNLKYLDDNDVNRYRSPDGGRGVTVPAEPGLTALLDADLVEGVGARAVWQRTRYGGLVGADVADVTVASDRAPGTVAVDDPDRFRSVDTGEPLPLEVWGVSDREVGEVVALALGGEIAAVVPLEPGSALARVSALLLPDAFTDGDNEVTAYLVDGPAGAPTLTPLDVGDAREMAASS